MIKKTITTLLRSMFSSTIINAQTISGNLSKLTKKIIKLEGFNGLKTYPIATTDIDEKGNFTFNWKSVVAGLDVSNSSNNNNNNNNNAVIVFDLFGRSNAYAALDNLVITSSNSSIINTIAEDLTVQCLSNLPAVPAVTAFDNCDASPSVSFTQVPPTPTRNVQTILRIWTAFGVMFWFYIFETDFSLKIVIKTAPLSL